MKRTRNDNKKGKPTAMDDPVNPSMHADGKAAKMSVAIRRSSAKASLANLGSVDKSDFSSKTANPEQSEGFSRAELREISQDLAARFPVAVEQTELVLMDVDPRHVHAYWHIETADLAAARTAADRKGKEAPLVLRLHDLRLGPPGANPRPWFDIEIDGSEGHWLVELWEDAQNFVAELGLRMTDGQIALLARSNRVQMPVASPPTPERADLQIPGPAQPQGTAQSASPPQDDNLPLSPAAQRSVPDRTLATPQGQRLDPEFPQVERTELPSSLVSSIARMATPGRIGARDPDTDQPHGLRSRLVRRHSRVVTGPDEAGAIVEHGISGAGIETWSSDALCETAANAAPSGGASGPAPQPSSADHPLSPQEELAHGKDPQEGK